VCVCLLSSSGVFFYQDQTAAQALATEHCALLSALARIIILLRQKVSAIEVGRQGKTVKAGDLVKGFHPHKSHATHPNTLKTQTELFSSSPIAG